MNLIDAIIHKYGFKQGLDIEMTKNGERITKWPYEVDQPKVSELPAIIAEYQPILDYKVREVKRDEIEKKAVVLYQGKLILMDDRSRKSFSQIKDSLKRRVKKINWKVQDSATGEKSRIKLSAADIEKFEDAVTDAIEQLHIQADTQTPDNPWPLEVS